MKECEVLPVLNGGVRRSVTWGYRDWGRIWANVTGLTEYETWEIGDFFSEMN